MVRVLPNAQLANVGVAGATATFKSPHAQDWPPFDRLVVIKTAGDATKFTVEFSTDQTFADPLKTFAKYVDVTEVDDADDFPWEGASTFYAKVTPDAGSNNNFSLAVFIDQGE